MKYFLRINFNIKLILSFVFLANVNAYSQSSGEIISYRTTLDTIVKGDMAIVGNSILGVEGLFDGESYLRHTPYNGEENNGATYVEGQYNYTREYFDIDNKEEFKDLFSEEFKLDTSNFVYGGELDDNGVPASYSSEGTFSSSGAMLNLPNDCARVEKAFLYWSGVYVSERYERVDRNTPVFITPRSKFCGDNCADFTEVKILPPNGDQYYDISINPLQTNNPNSISLQTQVIVDGLTDSYFNNNIPRNVGQQGQGVKDEMYVCRADVTSLMQSLQGNGDSVSGFWTVGNIRATTGVRSGQGLTGGWHLAVIYKDSSQSEKQIYFFDGFSKLSVNNDPVTIETPSLSVPPDGNIKSSIATASLEGDRSFDRDQFLIETATTLDRGVVGGVPMKETSMTGADNSTNFFNSTITGLTGEYFRVPAFKNTLGFDVDHFQLDNTNNQVIDNATYGFRFDRAANFILKTDRDSFSNYFIAMALEYVSPEVIVLTKEKRLNGTEISQDDKLDFEEEFFYELNISNVGNDVAVIDKLEDYLPANVSLLPISNTSTPVFPDDYFEFEGFTTSPTVERTANVVNPSFGILFPYATDRIRFTGFPNLGYQGCQDDCGPKELVIRFKVKVISECSDLRNQCLEIIQNDTSLDYRGVVNDSLVSGEGFFAESNCSGQFVQGPSAILINEGQGCPSIERQRCQIDGNVSISGGQGFESYKVYFYPLTEITDSEGRLLDVDDNVVSFLTDEDYPIDTSKLITPTSNPSDASAFLVQSEGYYIIESIASNSFPSCVNQKRTFLVRETKIGDSEIEFVESTVNSNPGIIDVKLVEGKEFSIPELGIRDRMAIGASGTSRILIGDISNVDLESADFYVDICNTENITLNVWSEAGCMKSLGFVNLLDFQCATLKSNSETSSKLDDIKLYPNPIEDNLFVEHNGANIEVQVYGANGLLVFQEKELKEGFISLRHLPNGVYFVKLGYDNEIAVKKVVIAREN